MNEPHKFDKQTAINFENWGRMVWVNGRFRIDFRHSSHNLQFFGWRFLQLIIQIISTQKQILIPSKTSNKFPRRIQKASPQRPAHHLHHNFSEASSLKFTDAFSMETKFECQTLERRKARCERNFWLVTEAKWPSLMIIHRRFTLKAICLGENSFSFDRWAIRKTACIQSISQLFHSMVCSSIIIDMQHQQFKGKYYRFVNYVIAFWPCHHHFHSPSKLLGVCVLLSMYMYTSVCMCIPALKHIQARLHQRSQLEKYCHYLYDYWLLWFAVHSFATISQNRRLIVESTQTEMTIIIICF